jgi:hypothetical protein
MDASPATLAVIERILNQAKAETLKPETVKLEGGEAVARVVQAAMKRLEQKLEALARSNPGMRRESVLRDDTAERIFDLMKRLETDPKKKKAQLLTVFRITVLEGGTQKEAARICKCRESLVSRRVATLEERFGMSIEELRYYASKVLDLESAARGERGRKKKQGARPVPDEAGDAGDGAEDSGDEEV